MKLIVVLALAAAPSVIAMAPYVPDTDTPTASPTATPSASPTTSGGPPRRRRALEAGGVAVQAASGRGAASCAAGAHTWRMINEPTEATSVVSCT